MTFVAKQPNVLVTAKTYGFLLMNMRKIGACISVALYRTSYSNKFDIYLVPNLASRPPNRQTQNLYPVNECNRYTMKISVYTIHESYIHVKFGAVCPRTYNSILSRRGERQGGRWQDKVVLSWRDNGKNSRTYTSSTHCNGSYNTILLSHL